MNIEVIETAAATILVIPKPPTEASYQVTDAASEEPESGPLTTAIPVRLSEDLKERATSLAQKMSDDSPRGSRRVTISDVTRMALAKYVDENEGRKA